MIKFILHFLSCIPNNDSTGVKYVKLDPISGDFEPLTRSVDMFRSDLEGDIALGLIGLVKDLIHILQHNWAWDESLVTLPLFATSIRPSGITVFCVQLEQ